MEENYPYWRPDFDKEFKGLEVRYREKNWPKHVTDGADSYRVFMILCNENYDKPRMEVLQMLKDATEEKPIQIQNEIFWTEKL